MVFRGARIRYGTEVSWFVKCLPSSTGEIHYYDTEVKKNNFGQVLASGDKILWRGRRRWSAIFFKGRTKPESYWNTSRCVSQMTGIIENAVPHVYYVIEIRNMFFFLSATYVDQVGSTLSTFIRRKFIVFVIK